jgi:hypothetical protein
MLILHLAELIRHDGAGCPCTQYDNSFGWLHSFAQ